MIYNLHTTMGIPAVGRGVGGKVEKELTTSATIQRDLFYVVKPAVGGSITLTLSNAVDGITNEYEGRVVTTGSSTVTFTTGEGTWKVFDSTGVSYNAATHTFSFTVSGTFYFRIVDNFGVFFAYDNEVADV